VWFALSDGILSSATLTNILQSTSGKQISFLMYE